MSYTDDIVKAKLAALNETQDSIVTVAQWIMFHRRQADRTASIWLNRLQESPSASKRLNLIYLANEVVQQSRARAKPDFMMAFEPLIAEATAVAYKGASQDIQGKIRRVVDVWRQRSIFDIRIQEAAEKRLDEIDKTKSGSKLVGGGVRLGGSLFGGGGVAPELDAVNKSQAAVSKAETTSKPLVTSADNDYAKMTDPSTPVPSAPVRAAKLGGLVKTLMAAQNAVDASIRARQDLLAGLERLLESNRAKIAEEETTSKELRTKIDGMEATIRDVEDSIMRGVDAPPNNGNTNDGDYSRPDPERPETEGFTPPPEVESFTPPGHAMDAGNLANEPPPSFAPSSSLGLSTTDAKAFLENLSALQGQGQVRSAAGEIPAASTGGNPGDPRLKRRKMNHNDMDDDFFSAGNVGGVDEDGISAMLGQ